MVSQTFVNAPLPGGGFISTRAMIHTGNKSNTEIHPYASMENLTEARAATCGTSTTN